VRLIDRRHEPASYRSQPNLSSRRVPASRVEGRSARNR
jgi:hypothetical protein